MQPSYTHPKAGGYRELLKVAYPLIVSTASFTLMQFADRVFLARYSAEAIQAALPAGILAFTLVSFFHALAGYASAFVAQYHGAGDRAGCVRATAQGVWLSLVSAPLIWALEPVGRWIMERSGHAPAVLAQEIVYFRILMWGGFAVCLVGALSGFFNGRGDTRTSMIATVAGNLVNLALDYAMIFGHWGFPRMGIAGAGWATVIGTLVTVAILVGALFSPGLQKEYGVGHRLGFDRGLFLRLLRFGVPAAVHLLLDVGSFTVFVLLTGRLSGVPLAASNIAISINNVAFQPLLGLNAAASILVGQYQGRRDSRTAERAGWTALKTGWIYMAVVGLTYALLPELYLRLFIGGASALDGASLLRVGRPLLLMMAAWGMFDTISIILNGALRGAGDTRFCMVYSVVMGWLVWIPGEVALVFWLRGRRTSLPEWMGEGMALLWAWMTIYVMILCAGFLWRFRSGRWKEIQLIEPAPVVLPPRAGGDALTVAE